MNKLFIATAVVALLLCGNASSQIINYTNDFELEGYDTLPAGWYDQAIWWGTAPPTALVKDAPKMVAGVDNKALRVEFPYQWHTGYGNSDGEIGYTMIPGGLTGTAAANSNILIEYDMWKLNRQLWMQAGDQISGQATGGWHTPDGAQGEIHDMLIGNNAVQDMITYVEQDWMHYSQFFDAKTDVWTTTITIGGVPLNFNGLAADPVYGEFWLGGWGFKSQQDDLGRPGYDNCVYLDNFEMTLEIIPEPGTLVLIGTGLVGLLALRRRRR